MMMMIQDDEADQDPVIIIREGGVEAIPSHNGDGNGGSGGNGNDDTAPAATTHADNETDVNDNVDDDHDDHDDGRDNDRTKPLLSERQRVPQQEQQLLPSPQPRRSKVRELLLTDDEIQATPTPTSATATATAQYAKDSTANPSQSLIVPATTVSVVANDDDQRSLQSTPFDGAEAETEAASVSASASAAPTTVPTGDDMSPLLRTHPDIPKVDTIKEEEYNRSVASLSMKMVGSTYTGGKMQHIKKDDGLPLWRADIQYDFLNAIFSNELLVFTPASRRPSLAANNPWPHHSPSATKPAEKQRFADLYIDAILQSEKTSKTLRHQITTERSSAINIAMVCLLVNLGRMNTTLCFSPEVKANLRTYHSIPCLQANVHDYEDHMYKQLQDAPRLKSILKRAADQDPNQIFTLDDLRNYSPPRMNPISLIFLLSQYAPKISELHFTPPTDFYDLVMRPEVSSQSRARAFLWLMWFYLESDFSEDSALSNPFGAPEIVEKGEVRYLKIPPLELLTDAERAQENIDTKEEQVYGETMQKQRKALFSGETQEQPIRPVNRRGGKPTASQDESYSSSRLRIADRTAAPELHGDGETTPENMLFAAEIAEIQTNDSPHSGETSSTVDLTRTRSSRRATQSGTAGPAHNTQPLATRIILKTRNPSSDVATTDTNAKNNLVTYPSETPPINRTPLPEMKTLAPSGGSTTTRRSRPMTQHQIALAQSRQQRIDHVLSLGRAEKIREMRELRKEMEKNTSVVMRAKQLLSRLPEDYDTDNDDEVIVDSQTMAVPNVNAAVNQNAIGGGGGSANKTQSAKSWGPGGLCSNPATEEDYGELAQFYSSVLRKVGRRLGRWDWDASLQASKEPEPVVEPPAVVPESTPDVASNGLLPPVVAKRGGRRRGTKRTAAAQDTANAPPEKRPRTGGGRSRAGEATKRRVAARSSPADKGVAANVEEEEFELASAIPARLKNDATHAESSDVDASNISQFNDGDPMDEDIASEPVQQPEDPNVDSMGEDPADTTLGQLEPDQSYPRHENAFLRTKPTLKSIDRLRPQSHNYHYNHHQHHHNYSSQQHDHEDLDSETSSIAFPDNDTATSDIDGSAASGDEGISLAEGNDVGDEDQPDAFNASDGDGAGDQPHSYSDTP